MSNNIEEYMGLISQDLDILINNIINLPEITVTAIIMNKQPLLLKFKSILVDRERLLKENEEKMKLKEYIKLLFKFIIDEATDVEKSELKQNIKEIRKIVEED